MERLEEIKGFIIYSEDAPKPTEEVKEVKEEETKEEDAQTEGEATEAKTTVVKMRAMDEEIIEKFQNKTLKEFVPCFILNQFAHEKHLEYLDFDQCVDEYFSQAEKQKVK